MPRPQPHAARADDALVALARAGDRAAFAALVERHRARICRLAYRFLNDAADAEDAAQETFVRAYTRLATYAPGPGEGRFAAWLAAICAHWCVDALRARGRRPRTVPLDPVAAGTWLADRAADPQVLALARAEGAALGRWLAALPPHYRRILALRYGDQLSYLELAAALGEPVSTVRMRLLRARALLRRVAAASEAPPPAGAGVR